MKVVYTSTKTCPFLSKLAKKSEISLDCLHFENVWDRVLEANGHMAGNDQDSSSIQVVSICLWVIFLQSLLILVYSRAC